MTWRWSAGALGAEGVHRGGLAAGENQRRGGHHAWGSGRAHHTPTPATAPSGLQPPVAIQVVHSHQGEPTAPLMLPLHQFLINNRTQNDWLDPQGRFDALLALLRRQYDRVAIMRPTSHDKVRTWLHITSIIVSICSHAAKADRPPRLRHDPIR